MQLERAGRRRPRITSPVFAWKIAIRIGTLSPAPESWVIMVRVTNGPPMMQGRILASTPTPPSRRRGRPAGSP